MPFRPANCGRAWKRTRAFQTLTSTTCLLDHQVPPPICGYTHGFQTPTSTTCLLDSCVQKCWRPRDTVVSNSYEHNMSFRLLCSKMLETEGHRCFKLSRAPLPFLTLIRHATRECIRCFKLSRAPHTFLTLLQTVRLAESGNFQSLTSYTRFLDDCIRIMLSKMLSNFNLSRATLAF